MTAKTIHSLYVTLREATPHLAVVTPIDKPMGEGCCRLINSRKTWLTASAGDAVPLTDKEKTERCYIESIKLYRVYPISENGRVVESGQAWLDGE
ncbi:MAG: hypothetical protein AABP62_20960 [Planctomycetota bacterium]